MDPLAPVPRRPRPVAGLPVVDPRAVAKAWLVELIAGVALEEAAAVPAADLAREGPLVAEAVLAALSDDAGLARFASGGDLAGSAILAAFSGPAGVRAAEALRRATQAALLAEARLDPTTTAELADRLAHVCALVAESAAAQPGAAEPAGPHPARRRGIEHLFPPRQEQPPDGGEMDVHRGADALRERHERGAEPGSPEAAVERRLERHAQDGSPFALLAVEADGLERLLAAQGDEGGVDELLEALERALAAELRPADQLLRDRPGRYWVTAPDTGPAVARLLAERLAEGATSAASHRGVPLTVSIGVATCPEHGEDAETLAAEADRAMFQARAAGTPVV